MKDYRVDVRVRNNPMLHVMGDCGFKTAADLWRASGVDQGTIGMYLNLQRTPYNSAGEVAAPIAKICSVLNCQVEDIFPPQHLISPLETNKGSAEVSFSELSGLLEAPDPFALIEKDQEIDIIQDALSKLTDRQRIAINMHYGLNDTDATGLREVGEVLGCSAERTRQIIAAGMRRLRHFETWDKLVEAFGHERPAER